MSFPHRVSWIDICKGIGIILVIYGHALYAEEYRYLIYAFHMPLFFFLSGLTFNYDKYQDKFIFLVKKTAKSILLPYLFFALLSYSFWLLENGSTFSGALIHFSGIIYGNSSSLFFNIVLWFLPCLFITKIAFAFLTKYIREKTHIILALLLFSFVGYFISISQYNIKLPFGIETLFTAVVFFGIGSLWTKYYQKRHSYRLKKYAFPLFFLSLVICGSLASLNYSIYGHQIDLRLNNLGNYFFFYPAALAGITSIIIMSKLIKKNFLLEYIGKYSLVLFALHPIVFPYFTKIITLVINEKTLNSNHDTYFSPLYTIFSISTILFITVIMNKLHISQKLLSLPKIINHSKG